MRDHHGLRLIHICLHWNGTGCCFWFFHATLLVSFSYLLKELVERMKWYKRRSSGEQAYDSFRSRRQQTFSRLQVCCSALWNNEGRNSKCSFMKTPTNAKFDDQVGGANNVVFLVGLDWESFLFWLFIPHGRCRGDSIWPNFACPLRAPASCRGVRCLADYPGDKPIKTVKICMIRMVFVHKAGVYLH